MTAARDKALGAVVALFLTCLAAASGGYFPTAWGWSALFLLWIAALALVVSPSVAFARRDLVAIGGLTAFAGWTCLSSLWASGAARPVLESERALVYAAALAALLLVARPASLRPLLGGVLAATTAVAAYALGTRLLPDRLGAFDSVAVYRLGEPVGYWNGLGLLCALGSLLALGLVAHGRRFAVRAPAAASLVVLVLTLYFTFSRGAWLALALGLCATFAFEARRGSFARALLVATPAPAAALWLASRSEALTRRSAELEQAAAQGHRLALVVLALAALAAALSAVRAPRRAALAAVAAAIVAVVAVGAATAQTHGTSSLGRDLNHRLFSLSTNGRSDLWAAAWSSYREHPVLGAGAGSYEAYWLEHREYPLEVRDAHSLYVEVLSELGPVGLGLLLVALAVPLVAARRARHRPLAASAFGAYAAFLFHAAVDWDWELTAVTLVGLACGAALLVAARAGDPPRAAARRTRILAVAATLALAAAAFGGLLVNRALAASAADVRARDFAGAQGDARRALRLAPWSSEAHAALGRAQLADGAADSARASFREALDRDPRDWSLWLDLAWASVGEERAAAIRRALELNPLSAEVARLEPRPEEAGAVIVP